MSLQAIQAMQDVDVLARIIEAEAGQEPLQGKLAVGAVIDNRRRAGGYGDGWKEVITKPGQFSAINDVTGYAGGQGANKLFWGDPSQESMRVAQLVLQGRYKDPTGGATHYFNPQHADPKWARGKRFNPIGNHVFGMADAGRISGGGGADILTGGPGQDYTIEEIDAEIARRQQPGYSMDEVDAEIARRKVVEEGPSEQDRVDVEHAISQLRADDLEAAEKQLDGRVRQSDLPMMALSSLNPAVAAAFLAGKVAPDALPDNEGTRWLRRTADLMTNGVTAGFSDSVAALLNANLRGADYEDEVARQRGAQEATENISPAGSIGAKAAGALMTGGGLAGAGVTMMKSGAGLGQTIGRGMAEGAAYGAAYGAGEADEGNILEGAGSGALLGAGVGAAAPVVLGALKQVPSALRTVGNLLGIKSGDKRAERLLLEAIDQDGGLLEPIQGKPDTLLDIGGDNVRRLAEVARSVPTQAGSRMTQALDDRVISQGGRIADDAAQFLGVSGDGFFATTQEILKRRSQQVRPIYESLRKQSMPITDVLADLVDRPAMQAALRKSAAEIKNRTGRHVDLSQKGVPFELLDQAKKEIDAMIRWDRSPMNSAQGANQSALKELQANLLGEMDAHFKGYSKARSVFAGETALKNAMEDGRAFMRGDADELAAEFAKLPRSERDAFRLGVARQIREMVEKTGDTSDAARRLINNQDMRRRLRVVTRGDKGFQQFLANLQRESQYVQTRNEITRGSQTQPRQAATDAALAGAEAAMTGGTPGVLRVVKNHVLRRARGIDKNTANKLAEMVSSEDLEGVISYLRSSAGRDVVNRSLHDMPEEARNMILRVMAAGSSDATN